MEGENSIDLQIRLLVYSTIPKSVFLVLIIMPCKMLILGEAWGRVYGSSLQHFENFSVNLQLVQNKKLLKTTLVEPIQATKTTTVEEESSFR